MCVCVLCCCFGCSASNWNRTEQRDTEKENHTHVYLSKAIKQKRISMAHNNIYNWKMNTYFNHILRFGSVQVYLFRKLPYLKWMVLIVFSLSVHISLSLSVSFVRRRYRLFCETVYQLTNVEKALGSLFCVCVQRKSKNWLTPIDTSSISCNNEQSNKYDIFEYVI